MIKQFFNKSSIVILAIAFLAVGYNAYASGGTSNLSGGGSGDVGAGTTGQSAYYAAGGTTLTATSSLFFNADGSVTIGTVIIDSIASSTTFYAGDGAVATPSITFASDTDRGWYQDTTGGGFGYANAGTRDWFITGNAISSNDSAGAGLRDEASSATNPSVLPRRSNTSSGIGSRATDILTLIASSTPLLDLIGPGVETATTSAGRVQLPNNVYLTGEDAYSSFVNIVKVNTSGQLQFGGEAILGTRKFEMNSGLQTHTYMNVSASSTDGEEHGFDFSLDGSSVARMTALSDGAGGVDTLQFTLDSGGTFGTAANPTQAFSDGDSGIAELSDDTMLFTVGGGLNTLYYSSAGFRDADNNSWGLLNEAPSATNPNIVPRYNELTSGIGAYAVGTVSVIASSTEHMRFDGAISTGVASTTAYGNFKIDGMANMTRPHLTLAATSTQSIGAENIPEPIIYQKVVDEDGDWSVVDGDDAQASSTIPETGSYDIVNCFQTELTTGTNKLWEFKIFKNNAEIPYSGGQRSVNTASDVGSICRKFNTDFNAGDIVRFDMAGNSTNLQLFATSSVFSTMSSASVSINQIDAD